MLIGILIASALFLTVISAQGPCQNPGDVICSEDCSELILCLGAGRNFSVQSCDSSTGIYCYAPLQDCSSVHNSCNNSAVYPLICHAMGLFPDPEDCKWYHLCSQEGGESLSHKCQVGRGYNASTYSCSKNLGNDGCQAPFGTCSKVGQVFVNIDNKQIFSICIKDEERGLIHDVYICENGNDFDLENLKCPEWDESDLSNIPFMFRGE